MKEFILAALPWVMAGIPLAILCAAMARKRTKAEQKKLSERMSLGIALGLLWGVAMNGCGLWESHVLGFALGPLWGMALAALYSGKAPQDQRGDSDS